MCNPELIGPAFPVHGWTMVTALGQPRSTGRVRLRAGDPFIAPAIELDALCDPGDLKLAKAAVTLAREIGAGAAFQRLGSREVLPGASRGVDLEAFVRSSAMTYWHQSCTARMGRTDDAVVGPDLTVRGVSNLMIADASIMPRIPSGNTMAPCVVIGERAAQMLRKELAPHAASERDAQVVPLEAHAGG